jgi:hypothetical protein
LTSVDVQVREWDEVKDQHSHRLMSNAATSPAINQIAKPSKIEPNRITGGQKMSSTRQEQ